MIDGTKDEGLLETAKLVSAVRGYQLERMRRKEEIVDFTVSPSESDDRILIRVIARHEGKAGYVGIDAVKEMSRTLDRRRYSKGILVGKRFTEAAKNEMKREDIETVSAGIPRFKLDELYLVIQDHVDVLCNAKCGQAPEKELDCQGYINGDYTCKVRLLSDDAGFHFEHGWTSLLERDLMKLLTIEEDLKDRSLSEKLI
jgi:hypothetical protein